MNKSDLDDIINTKPSDNIHYNVIENENIYFSLH